MSRVVRMARVVSKNLFDFKPAGKYDDNVAKLFETMEKMGATPEAKLMQDRMKELVQREDEEANAEFLPLIRAQMEAILLPIVNNNPVYSGVAEKIVTTSFTVLTEHDGKFDVPVEVYTPKAVEGDKKRAVYIYAHGGGVVAMDSASMRKPLSKYAADTDLVIYNVDYRIAPETKCPNNIKDFYEVIKYAHVNAENLGIDPDKICIGGDSGGGYICLGAMVLLTQHNEGDIVKLAVPGIPMTDDYCFSDPLAMTVEERKDCITMRKFWKHYIAADWEAQKHDPHLFPGKASEELLEKFPPTIIMSSEFDMFITETTRLASRLRRAGRLYEFVVIPGSPHGAGMFTGTKVYDLYWDTMNTIAKEYMHG